MSAFRRTAAALAISLAALVAASVTLVGAAAAAPAVTQSEPIGADVINGRPAIASDPGVNAIVAILGVGAPSASAAQSCGGVLIAPRVVLTARHCVESPPYLYAPAEIAVARAANGGLLLPPQGFGGVTSAGVASIHRSAGTYAAAMDRGDDLAVLRLSHDLPGTTPMTIARPGDEAWWGGATGRATGVNVIGWGATTDTDVRTGTYAGGYPNVLQYASLPTVDPDTCALRSRTPAFTRHFLCAGAIGSAATSRSACYGDSGGPLLATDPAAADGDPGAGVRLVGIVSNGEVDACTAAYGRFVRVADHAAWIDSFIATGAGAPSDVHPPVLVTTKVVRAGTRVQLAQHAEGAHSVAVAPIYLTPGGSRVELPRVGMSTARTTSATLDLRPSRSGTVRLLLHGLDVAGVESADRVLTVPTRVDRTAPRLASGRATSLGHGLWGLRLGALADDDRPVAVTVEHRRPGTIKWHWLDVIACDSCFVSRTAHVPRTVVLGDGAGRWQFRLTPIDRAGNRGRPVVTG